MTAVAETDRVNANLRSVSSEPTCHPDPIARDTFVLGPQTPRCR